MDQLEVPSDTSADGSQGDSASDAAPIEDSEFPDAAEDVIGDVPLDTTPEDALDVIAPDVVEIDAGLDAIDMVVGAEPLPDVAPIDVPAVDTTFVVTCSTCHGDETSPAPPRSVRGDTATTSRGVGAHRSHLRASTWHREVRCDDCHIVPTEIRMVGHYDTDIPAELTFSTVATADGALPRFDGTRCTNVFCHGATLDAGGTNTSPDWTRVDGTEASCGTCHALPPPPPHPPVRPGLTACSRCHPFDGIVPRDPSTHINGVVDLAPCGSCHGAPPATGAHLAHYGDPSTTPVVRYGDLRIAADFGTGATGTYMFGCGYCHPTDPSRHMDGTLDVELTPSAAPAGSIRARNLPSARYSGGTCSNVYCHSSGQQNPAFVTTPQWTGHFTGSRCASCHANPPAYPNGGPGSTTANTHIVMGDDNWELGHFAGLPGPWHGSYHGSPGAAPITCQTCHYRSVDPANVGPGGLYYLDTDGVYNLGGDGPYVCTSCHNGTAGAPAQGHGAIVAAFHVNGTRNVDFDPRTSVANTVSGIPTGANRPTYPYWIPAIPSYLPPDSTVNGTTWSLNLSHSTYDPATKTCGAVPCHLRQSSGTGNPTWEPLVWGQGPVGWSTCSACHQFY